MQWSIPFGGTEIPILADDGAGSTVVILAPGAGSHMHHKTLEWLASLARDSGARVVRFNFLYRVEGRSMPDRMPKLMSTYRAVIDSVRERLKPETLVIGGHSMGGRVASSIEAEGKCADGLLLFGYPLHPAGQPEKLRDEHLSRIKTPTLQLNGTLDELCTQELMQRTAESLDPNLWRLRWIEGADHSYSVTKSSGRTRKEAEEDIQSALSEWLGSISR